MGGCTMSSGCGQEPVGALVGAAVGALVGDAVGALVGDAVGALVGEPAPGGVTLKLLTMHWAMYGHGCAATTPAYTNP